MGKVGRKQSGEQAIGNYGVGSMETLAMKRMWTQFWWGILMQKVGRKEQCEELAIGNYGTRSRNNLEVCAHAICRNKLTLNNEYIL